MCIINYLFLPVYKPCVFLSSCLLYGVHFRTSSDLSHKMKRCHASDQKASVTGQNGIVTQTERLQVSGKTTSGVRSLQLGISLNGLRLKGISQKVIGRNGLRLKGIRQKVIGRNGLRLKGIRQKVIGRNGLRWSVTCRAAPPHVTSHARGSEQARDLTPDVVFPET